MIIQGCATGCRTGRTGQRAIDMILALGARARVVVYARAGAT